MRRVLVVSVFLLAVLLGFGLSLTAQPGPPKTYTCQWDHDGVGTDSYAIVVDGVVATTMLNSAAICPAATPRVCSSPLTMTTNVAHVVTVKALNAFGEATSDPFSAAPPGARPASVVIR
jgi:hypothetical protein